MKKFSTTSHKTIAGIVEAIEGLNILPHRYGPMRNALKFRREVRSMPVPPFLVRYEIKEPNLTVLILSVRHGARESDM